MSKTPKWMLTLLVLPLIWSGCKKWDKEEPIPAYLYLGLPQLETNLQTGSNSHRITDYWVYIDDNLLGAFEYPLAIPVLKSGKHKLEIRAGVRLNGAAGLRTAYPFYASYVLEHDFKPEQQDTIMPLFRYRDGVEFVLMEDFEDQGTVFKLKDPNQTYTRTDDVFKRKEPQWSGVLQAQASELGIELQSINNYLLNREGEEVWFEMDYKTNVNFSMGVYGTLSTGDVLGFGILQLKPNSEWNHIYIRMTDDVSSQPSGTKYAVYLRGENFELNTACDIYIDNIKLIQFKR